MTVLLIIFVLGVLLLLCWVIIKMVALDDRQEELDKYQVHLNEREARLECRELELRIATDEYSATYTVTESDLMKYDGDERIQRVAMKAIANTIAGDILKTAVPVIDEVNGHKRYTYKVKIVR